MKLFEQTGGAGQRPKRRAENTFSYLSASERRSMVAARELIETWFADYPENRQASLRRDFRRDFDAAYFELLIHEVLRRVEDQVLVHPSLDGSVETRPDFLVNPERSDAHVVEVTVAYDESDEEVGLRRVRDDLTDRIDQLDLPDWLLDVTWVRCSSEQESIARIEGFLRQELGSLDPDGLLRQIEDLGWDVLPVFTFESERACIKFRPIPRRPERRGQGHGIIGAFSPTDEAVQLLPAKAIRRAVERKRAARYGDFDLPYLVAVNALAEYRPHFRDVVAALYGDEAVRFGPKRNGPDVFRIPNGIWRGPKGINNTRISAVVAAIGLKPWSFREASLYVFLNPHARQPYPGALNRLKTVVLEDGRLQQRDGETLASILDIPEEWPVSD